MEERISCTFYNKHLRFLQKQQSSCFFNLKNTDKIIFHRHVKSFHTSRFPSPQQDRRRHPDWNPPRSCPTPPPPVARKGLGCEGPSPGPGGNPAPFFSQVCRSRRLSPNCSSEKGSRTGNRREVIFQSPQRKPKSPTCGSRCMHGFLPPSGVTSSEPSGQGVYRAASSITAWRTFRKTPQASDAHQRPHQAFSRAILCSGTESSLTL